MNPKEYTLYLEHNNFGKVPPSFLVVIGLGFGNVWLKLTIDAIMYVWFGQILQLHPRQFTIVLVVDSLWSAFHTYFGEFLAADLMNESYQVKRVFLLIKFIKTIKEKAGRSN
jgi:hypothetical protein